MTRYFYFFNSEIHLMHDSKIITISKNIQIIEI